MRNECMGTWPEQEVIEQWLDDNDLREHVSSEAVSELKELVTAYRIIVQQELDDLRTKYKAMKVTREGYEQLKAANQKLYHDHQLDTLMIRKKPFLKQEFVVKSRYYADDDCFGESYVLTANNSGLEERLETGEKVYLRRVED